MAGTVDVWIDTDVAIGAPWREVDDAFALLLASNSPELHVVGVSTTYGNAPLATTTTVARRVVERLGGGRDRAALQVYPGAASAGAFAVRTAASDALGARLVTGSKINYIALGPLTNFATLLQLHPTLARHIERVFFLGGQSPAARLGFGPRGDFVIHDANVWKDPAAVQTTLESGIPITLVPIEIGGKLTISRSDLAELKDSGPRGAFIADRSWFWFRFWTWYVRNTGGPVFDALAVIAAATPDLVHAQERTATITPAGKLIAQELPSPGSRAVKWVDRFDPRTHDFLVGRLVKRRGAIPPRR